MKAHEARNSFCYLLSKYDYFLKSDEVSFHPSLEKGLLGSLTLTSWSWFGEK